VPGPPSTFLPDAFPIECCGGDSRCPSIARHQHHPARPSMDRRWRGPIRSRVLLVGADAPTNRKENHDAHRRRRLIVRRGEHTHCRSLVRASSRHHCPPYPEALYYWAWSHGAYFGTDPTAPQPSGRTVALIIGALVAATSIATGLLFGLAYDPGSTPTPAIDPGPVAATLQHPAVPASPDTGGATGIVGS
jgi:hypothetical protein